METVRWQRALRFRQVAGNCARDVMLAGLMLAALLLAAVPANADPSLLALVAAARAQIGVTTTYDPSYRALPYPGGDLPPERGVCTDVVIRAYRKLGFDLQQAVHEDMKTAWSRYPRDWGLKRPDPSIDHRRVPNLVVYLRRQGAGLPTSADPRQYEPGDLVTWNLPSNVPHIGIVSDRQIDGRPLVIHNIGAGAQEEDVLFGFHQTGHFRLVPPPASP
jgi:uncharacterized protein YijF (DUF1287 family)